VFVCAVATAGFLSPAERSRSRVPLVSLRDGNAMPVVGFGTGGRTSSDKRYQSVSAALASGMRHIDTAEAYGDEVQVGKAIRDSGLRRDDVWITTKLPSFWDGAFSFRATLAHLQGSLDRLNVSYVDLYLIHSPRDATHRIDQWRALLRARELGLTRSIGVSNYAPSHLQELEAAGLELPVINQLEVHPWLTEPATTRYCEQHGIVIEAYAPLGAFSLWKEPRLAALAAQAGKSVPQVLLRWSIERGMVPIFGTDDAMHLRSNLEIFDFELSAESVADLSTLNADLHVFNSSMTSTP